MRRALISDIHGNLVALQAVLADIDTQRVDEIACLGDICGYGPQPCECIDLVRQRTAWTLKGNHDDALFNEPYDFGRNALIAIHWQRELLQPQPSSSNEQIDRWNWLKNLPAQRQERDVLYVHGSPRDYTYEYILREDFEDLGFGRTQKARAIFESMDWLCFCGHSHRPGVVTELSSWTAPAEIDPLGQVLRRGERTIVNIGSVGQPRDNNTAACYCIFEFDPPAGHDTTKVGAQALHRPASSPTLVGIPPKPDAAAAAENAAPDKLRDPKVIFRRVDYDIAAAQRRFKSVPELPEHNSMRLARGI